MYTRDDLLKAMKQYQKLYLKLSDPVRKAYSISQIEFDVIAFLMNHPQDNTAKNICKILKLTKSNVSVAIENLSKMNFISCKIDDQDKRIIRLQLMPKADSLQHKIKYIQNEFNQVLFNGISQEEIYNLFNTLSKINQNVVNKMEENKYGK